MKLEDIISCRTFSFVIVAKAAIQPLRFLRNAGFFRV